jgi:nitrate reductase gamma subunit
MTAKVNKSAEGVTLSVYAEGDEMSKTKLAIYMGRLCGVLALLALIGAWITELTGKPLAGMSQQHLFNDAIVLSLFCIAGLVTRWCMPRICSFSAWAR